MRTALGIPSPSCQVGNTEQSNTIQAGNLFLALRDRGVGGGVWGGVRGRARTDMHVGAKEVA